jgi:hypothetical protein
VEEGQQEGQAGLEAWLKADWEEGIQGSKGPSKEETERLEEWLWARAEVEEGREEKGRRYERGTAIYIDDVMSKHGGPWGALLTWFHQCQIAVEKGIQFKSSKIEVFAPMIDMLGMEVSEEGRRPSMERVQGIRKMKQPETRGQVVAFLGLCMWYRDFVPRLSQRSGALREGISPAKKKWRFKMTEEMVKEWADLRGSLEMETMLGWYDERKELRVVADASGEAVGAVLEQKEKEGPQEGVWRPLAFRSRRFTGPEKNWPVPEKELYSVVWALRQFHVFAALLFTSPHFFSHTRFE